MGSEGLHEDRALLDEMTIDRHRALISLQEELEAIDWYDQRIVATHDESLATILRHNRDEEKEHASMILEWLRRNDPVLDRWLRTYLFTSKPIVDLATDAEAAPEHPPEGTAGTEGSTTLGIGSLKGTE